MAGEGSIGEQQERLLRTLEEVARGDISGIASVYRVSERLGVDFVANLAAREELVALTRGLQEAGYVKLLGTDSDDEQRITHGGVSITEEGRSLLEAS